MEEVEFTTADLIKELHAYINEDRKPGGVSVREWAEAEEITTQHACNQLGKLLEEGSLTRAKARVDGRRCWVYYKATPAALA